MYVFNTASSGISYMNAIGKLFKLCKNENNTDISLHQIYLPKLPENLLKD